MTDTTFVLFCGLLAVVALTLFVLPTLRAGRESRFDRRRLLAGLYQQRRGELNAEIEAAAADGDTAGALRRELDASLLDEVADATAGAERVAGPRWPALVLGLLAPVLAAGVYLKVGDPDADAVRGASAVMSLADDDPQLDRWREVLQRRVDRRADDAESWYLYGHVLLKQQRYALAAEAFSRTASLVGEDPSVDTYWLQARYLAADGELDEQSEKLAQRILAADPANGPVLQLLSVHYARMGDFKESMRLLNKAQGGLRDPRSQASLLAFMEQVRSHLPVELPTIDVAVSAGAATPADATVFVVARPVGGGMPYAVARRPASMLPFAVRLDDLASMNPANPLSAAEQVEVVVRLSLTGQPTSQPGDWEWQSAPIVTRDMPEAVSLGVELHPPAAAG
ncbi:MAG: c-type cytochrome biogenesis protein CcmI [Pseudomonadales bacterium]|nr:c-type cytochrome biogenesis protein CcmI [Pseudomonadales bacterium]MCP5183160.1 c-type cytochrome biogenesis protein CcmI [Pseudomonadales bacterium]